MKKPSAARIVREIRGRGLPDGVITFTLSEEEGRPCVEAAYIAFPAHPSPVTKSQPFDEGDFVVDYNAAGEVVGIEFLGFRKPSEVPDFVRYAREAPPFIAAAAVEAMTSWMVLNTLLPLAPGVRKIRDALSGPKPGWTDSPFDDEGLKSALFDLMSASLTVPAR